MTCAGMISKIGVLWVTFTWRRPLVQVAPSVPPLWLPCHRQSSPWLRARDHPHISRRRYHFPGKRRRLWRRFLPPLILLLLRRPTGLHYRHRHWRHLRSPPSSMWEHRTRHSQRFSRNTRGVAMSSFLCSKMGSRVATIIIVAIIIIVQIVAIIIVRIKMESREFYTRIVVGYEELTPALPA